jgi:hypothetical protein
MRGCGNEKIVDKLPTNLTRECLLNDHMLQPGRAERWSSEGHQLDSSVSIGYESSRSKRTSTGYSDKGWKGPGGSKGHPAKRSRHLTHDTATPPASKSPPRTVHLYQRAIHSYRRQEYHLDISDTTMSTEELEPVDVIPAGPPVPLTNTDEVLKGTVPAPHEVQTGEALSSSEMDGTLMTNRYDPVLPASLGEVASAGRPVLPPVSGVDTVTPSDNTLVAVCTTKDKTQRRARIAQRALGTTLPAGTEVIRLPSAEMVSLMARDNARKAVTPAPHGSVAAVSKEHSSNDRRLGKRVFVSYLQRLCSTNVVTTCIRHSRKWQTLHRR